MIKSLWKSVSGKVVKSLKKATKDKSSLAKAKKDKWGEKQIKEMAKLQGKLILM